MGFIHKQIIIVGNSGCGKSSLVLRLTHSFFSAEYIPTEFESHTTEIETNGGNKVKLTLQDVSGAKESGKIRQLAYEGCDAILLCFDITDKNSYHSLETKWIPEITKFAPSLPVFIAACKNDESEGENEVFVKDIDVLADKLGAAGYMQCSACTNNNVETVFQQILQMKTQKQQNGVQKVISSTKKGIKKLYSN